MRSLLRTAQILVGADQIFGFRPGNGIHEIHMNQGNAPQYFAQDGVYQDGALLLHLPSENRWIGIFTKFQSQSWHTDDQTGHALTEVTPDDRRPSEPDLVVRIVAALVNPPGRACASTASPTRRSRPAAKAGRSSSDRLSRD